MSRFTAFTAILVTITLGSHGHPTMDIRAESRDNPSEVGNCTSYHSVVRRWTKCIAPDADEHLLTTDMLLAIEEYICGNKRAITTCMDETFGECGTWSTIRSMIDVSFEFCECTDIPNDLRTFLEINTGKDVDWKCNEPAFKGIGEVCDISALPNTLTQTLEGLRAYRKRYFDWHVSCFKRMPDLDRKLDKCDNMTKRAVFAFLLAASPTVSIGIDFYSGFKDVMESEVSPSLVERMFEQRSLFQVK